MRSAVLVVFAAALAVAAAASTKFTTKYDNVNLDDILKSDRLLSNYFECLMGRKSCAGDAKVLKEAIPMALKDDCQGCSEKQKFGAEKVIKYLIEHKKPMWHELEEKYDPDRTYRTKHKLLAEQHGVKL